MNAHWMQQRGNTLGENNFWRGIQASGRDGHRIHHLESLPAGDEATGSSFHGSLRNKQQRAICYILVVYNIQFDKCELLGMMGEGRCWAKPPPRALRECKV